MNRSVAILLTLVFVLVLGGCSGVQEIDRTRGWSASKLYTEAKTELADGNYENAIKLFETLESRYPYGRYAQQAQLEVAYAYHKSGEPASAIAACERFIRLHPNHPHVDYAYYLKGLVNFNEDLGLLGRVAMQDPSERDSKAARDSYDSFRELVTRFPDSKYTPDSKLRMGYLVNALASNEVHVARYYYKRGAFVAAANRAQYAVQTFPNAPAIEEAMFILVISYDQLGMKELRDDAERVMKLNFPNSPYYERGLNKPVPWWKLW
jgi:outer membrane protein assembly factor BamD